MEFNFNHFYVEKNLKICCYIQILSEKLCFEKMSEISVSQSKIYTLLQCLLGIQIILFMVFHIFWSVD